MPPIRKTRPSVAAVVEVVFIFGLHMISLYEEGSNFCRGFILTYHKIMDAQVEKRYFSIDA